MKIKINTIQDVRELANIASKYDLDIMLKTGNYVVDAKSLLGILSLNLTNPVAVTVNGGDSTQFMKEIGKFAV